MTAPVIAYLRGGDGFALDRAVVAIARRLEEETGAPPDRWRWSGEETSAARIVERVGTAPMFGGGCVVVVTDPGPLLRSKDGREALDRALGGGRAGQRAGVRRAGRRRQPRVPRCTRARGVGR